MIPALALALTLTAAGAPTARGPWILTCDFTRAPDAAQGVNGPRVFRLGPQLFQVWKPVEKQFGPNLCETLTCRGDQNRLEGDISSTTLIVTISLDLATHSATWRTQGASNLNATSGSCSVKADQAAAKPAPPGPLRSPVPGAPPR
jgi:hypothetical protein